MANDWAPEPLIQANYDLEMYARALEHLALMPHRSFSMLAPTSLGLEETPEQYAQYLHHHIGHSRALMQAAKMLRMDKGPLYVLYPDYFPEPEAPDA